MATKLTRGTLDAGAVRTSEDDGGHYASPPCGSRFRAVEGGQQIVDGEAGGVGVGQHARDERAQPPVALARRMRLGRRGADERSDAAPGLDDAGTLELAVHPRHRVGVDAELHRQLTHGRQLIAGAQAARGNRRAQPTLELGVDRRRVARVDRDDVHVSYYTSVLVQ